MTDSPSGLGLGIDVGTQGARVVIADEIGAVLARAERSWPLQCDASDEREQNPQTWWAAILACVRSALAEVNAHAVSAVSVSATSGTLVLCDADLRPVRPAMMWNDKRAREESDLANLALAEHPPTGYAAPQRPTSTLAKALWVRRHEPEVWRSVRHVLSAGDWILARLTQDEPATDYTNALKSAYDLESLRWPDAVGALGIDERMLPRVVAPATPIGPVSATAAAELGLPGRPTVVAGVTDANAAQIAGGAVAEGDWLTTIGTGLSVKGVSAVRLSDETGALYSHRHWDGGWIPSATSHCGADSIGRRFPSADLTALTDAAARFEVSSTLVLPLSTVGEFFPLWAPDATGFEVGQPLDESDLFRGYLEGIAFVEHLIMERVESAGALAAGPQVTMGGGASNTEWMSIRASVLGRSVSRPAETSSAFGAAVIALAGGPRQIDARVRAMVRRELIVDPEPDAEDRYSARRAQWRDELARRGYLGRFPATEGAST